ncbi:hypothetical protein C7S20_19385 [Christiangramia fulva]|uniref:Uncharacterized protein n=1 Tax=Christiangramia fulva TaxID=2126553 RepID=A0A2R3ZAH5_9FLAO|nr:hypothetical protein [Christiangramia fulva]AVR47240.1 hypothetical protein C7S20_19385 [Christiangramia fulva]
MKNITEKARQFLRDKNIDWANFGITNFYQALDLLLEFESELSYKENEEETKISFTVFQSFMNNKLEAKITSQENLFANETFPVIGIDQEGVTCDVLHHFGTESFLFEEVELIVKEK